MRFIGGRWGRISSISWNFGTPIRDRETLLQAIETGPVRVMMNDGSTYEIESLRDVAVDSTTCYLCPGSAASFWGTLCRSVLVALLLSSYCNMRRLRVALLYCAWIVLCVGVTGLMRPRRVEDGGS